MPPLTSSEYELIFINHTHFIFQEFHCWFFEETANDLNFRYNLEDDFRLKFEKLQESQ